MSSLDLQVPKLEAYQQIYGNGNAFSDLKKTAREDQQAALRPVAEQFEAMFLNQILKQARKVQFDEGFMDGKDADFYKDWYDQQLSQGLATKGSLGLADKIVEQLSQKLPTMSAAQYHEQLIKNKENAQSDLKELPKIQQSTADRLALRELQ